MSVYKNDRYSTQTQISSNNYILVLDTDWWKSRFTMNGFVYSDYSSNQIKQLSSQKID